MDAHPAHCTIGQWVGHCRIEIAKCGGAHLLCLAQVSADSQPQLLWSHDLQAQLKRSLSAATVKPMRLAGVPGASLKCKPIALLAASTPSSGGPEQVIDMPA